MAKLRVVLFDLREGGDTTTSAFTLALLVFSFLSG